MTGQSKLNHSNAGSQKRRHMEPPIPLTRPKAKELIKGQYESMKLRTVPTDVNSPTYELTIVYFSSGMPEEWLMFRKSLTKVIVGQNLTTGPGKYALVRRVLTGDALAAFEAAATKHGNITNDNFNACMADVTKHIFPVRALAKQKRFMRRFLRKQSDTKIREHVARVVEINEYLTDFPPARDGEVVTKIADDALLEILEFGCPNSWQKQMLLQDFDPMEHNVQEFVRFCERIENTEDRPEPKTKSDDNRRSDGKTKRSRYEGRRYDTDRPNKRRRFHCLLHGADKGHNTEDCKVLKAQAERMKGQYEAQHPEKKQYFKRKQELNALWQEKMEELLAAEANNTLAKKLRKQRADKKEKRKREASSDEEDYNFDKLEIKSDSDSDDESSTEYNA